MPFPAFSRLRLTKAVPEWNLPAGALGKIIRVVPADETRYVVRMDDLPELVLDLYAPDFMPNSPQHCAEIVYREHTRVGRTQSDPGELVPVPDETDDDGLPL